MKSTHEQTMLLEQSWQDLDNICLFDVINLILFNNISLEEGKRFISLQPRILESKPWDITPESFFQFIIEKSDDNNVVLVSQNSNLPATVLKNAHSYTLDEAKVLLMYLQPLIKDLIDCVNEHKITLKTEPRAVVFDSIMKQLLPSGYNNIELIRNHFFNNLSAYKINEVVTPFYLSEEVRKGAPFSIEASLKKVNESQTIDYNVHTGCMINCSWDFMLRQLEDCIAVTKPVDLSFDNTLINTTLTSLQHDIDNAYKTLLRAQNVELLSTGQIIQLLENSPISSEPYLPSTYRIVNETNGIGQYILVSIKGLYNGDIILNNFLQPASSIDEALTETELGRFKLNWKFYPNNELVLTHTKSRNFSNVFTHLMNSNRLHNNNIQEDREI